MDKDKKDTRVIVVACLALFLFTLALYSRVKSYSFINYDDQTYVAKNLQVRSGLSWKTFTWSLTATEGSNWHPLTWLSHALDCQLYGLNPAGHHLTSVLFHCLNVLLLFLLLHRATRLAGRSALVAALFALHPLNVESVVWIAERKNVLSTAFFFLAIGAYGWYALKPSVKRYVLVAVLFVLGLASKPMVITLPLVFFLLDFWPLGRIRVLSLPSLPARQIRNRKAQSQRLAIGTRCSVPQVSFLSLAVEKLPLLLLSAASAVVTVIAQRSGGAVRSLERIPLGLRVENATFSDAMYVWKAFWPARLALYYPLSRPASWTVGMAVLFLLAVSGLAWKQRFVRPYLMFGWLWYLVTLIPVIGIVQVGDQAMADRYAYVPLIGIFVLLVWGLADWADSKRLGGTLRAATTASIFAVLSFLTWRQSRYWRSSYDVWEHTRAVTRVNPMAEANLADALHALGRPEDALSHFQNAVNMQPNDPVRRTNLAEDLAECGRLQNAITEYETAIQLTSDPEKQARSYQSLAILHGELGEYSQVRQNYREALQIDSQLGEEMIRNLSQYTAAAPSGKGYLSLGTLLEIAGRLSEARVAYQQALKLDPTLADAKESLATLERSNK
jgi:tetratricopeptide (TPR) repeat protein